MENSETPPAPSAPTKPLRPAQADADAAALKEADERLPTIRELAESRGLKEWQIAALVARLHGAHVEKDGAQVRVFEHGVSRQTRMTVEDFDAALEAALHGRV